ncbi:MAG: MFS transporter [Candidatus Hodarchaeales archaeon]
MTSKPSLKNAYFLLFASQVINIGFGLLAIFITLLADDISLRPTEIGVIISIFAVARSITAAIIPAFSDRVGRRIILIFALLIYSTTTFLLGFSRDFTALFLLRIVEGAAAGAAFPTAEALLVDSVPAKDRGAWMGKYFTTFTFGFIIGPALGGVLFTFGTEYLGLNTLDAFIIPFAFTGLLSFISMLSIILFVHDVLDFKKRKKRESKGGKIRTQYLSSFILVGLLSGFAIGLIIPIFTLYMADKFFLDEGTIGIIFTVSGTAGLFVNYPAGKLSDKINRMLLVIIGMTGVGLGFIGVAFAKTLFLIVLFFIFRQISFQSYLPAYRAFQADKIHTDIRGKVMGRIQSAFNIGSVFGPLIGSAIYESTSAFDFNIFNLNLYGGAIPFLIAGLLGLVQVFIALDIFLKEKRNKVSIHSSSDL